VYCGAEKFGASSSESRTSEAESWIDEMELESSASFGDAEGFGEPVDWDCRL
jgi:hypothetical protein